MDHTTACLLLLLLLLCLESHWAALRFASVADAPCSLAARLHNTQVLRDHTACLCVSDVATAEEVTFQCKLAFEMQASATCKKHAACSMAVLS